MATCVVVNKPLEVAKDRHLATISLFIRCFVLVLKISEFKVQLICTTWEPPIISSGFIVT